MSKQVWAIVFLAGLGAAISPAAESPLELAAKIVEFSRAGGGISAVVGSGDAELAAAIAKQGSFVVQTLCEADQCDSLRKRIRGLGMYGRVSAGVLEAGRLPYTNNLVNILVVDRSGAVTPAEVVRVLAPLGVAYLAASDNFIGQLAALGVEDVKVVGRWVRLRKSWPAEIDEWTHYLHGADGNPVRVRAMVLAGGRLMAAGPPDVVDPKDPLGAFEGRKGGVLYWIDAASGKRLVEQELSSPPVFNGAAAAAGRLFVVQEDGAVVCLGKRPIIGDDNRSARFEGRPR